MASARGRHQAPSATCPDVPVTQDLADQPSPLDHCQGLRAPAATAPPPRWPAPSWTSRGAGQRIADEPDPSRPVAPQSTPPKPPIPHGFQAHFMKSRPSMKFVMDTSKFWFRPHINRAEAEATLKDRLPCVFGGAGQHVLPGQLLPGDEGWTPTTSPPTGCPAADVRRRRSPPPSSRAEGLEGGEVSADVRSEGRSFLPHTPHAEYHTDWQKTEDESHDRTESDVKNKTESLPLCREEGRRRPLESHSKASITPTIVNCQNCVFRRHYPAHLLSLQRPDPDKPIPHRVAERRQIRSKDVGFVAKSVEAGVENVCHVFAEHDPPSDLRRGHRRHAGGPSTSPKPQIPTLEDDKPP
ncbi:unnamed protein product [Arctogadus glacialis]